VCRDPSQTPVDCRKQLGIVDRLFYEIFGTGPDCRDRHGHVSMPGNQHHGQKEPAPRQLAYQLDAVPAGHSHIGNDAADRRARDLLRKTSAEGKTATL
jgi:hypothetical protein